MSDNPNLVEAYHTKTGKKQEVPAHWVDPKRTPFPGQWSMTPKSRADKTTDEAPAKNASTEAWQDYATKVKGATAEDIDGLGRDELVAKYGEED